MQLEVEVDPPGAVAIDRETERRLTAVAAAGPILVFRVSIFTSAYLLFLVEPMIAKMILPLAGGSPAVWTTSVLFFQSVLLVGYGYSHWLSMKLQWKWQAALHGALLLAPLPLLPIHLIPGWNPPSSNPAAWLVLVLSVAVGLPFLVLSTTSPLIQYWFSRTTHPQASDPYFLYRASNLGSALGLLSYPFLIEPWIGLRAQAQMWRVAYIGFLLVVAAALVALRRARTVNPTPDAAETAAGIARTISTRTRSAPVATAVTSTLFRRSSAPDSVSAPTTASMAAARPAGSAKSSTRARRSPPGARAGLSRAAAAIASGYS